MIEYDDSYYGFIYMTTNNVNGKKYIGQKTYKGNYVKYLGSGVLLNRAIDKYGSENFSKIILKNCKTKEELDECEIKYIEKYNATEDKNFYNIAKGGDGGNTLLGYSETDKECIYKKRRSSLKQNEKNKGKNNGNAKRVMCLNNKMIFNTTVEASEWSGVSETTIQQCSVAHKNGIYKTSKNVNNKNDRLQWCYIDEDKNTEMIVNNTKTVRMTIIQCVETKEIFTSEEFCKKYDIEPRILRNAIYYYKKNNKWGSIKINGLKYHFIKIKDSNRKIWF